MTREEAIEVIRKEYACVDADCDIERNCGRCELHMPSKDPILKAYEMAIQALSQEPCDDAISREDAINAFDEHPYDTLSYASARNIIRELPSVTQKSGKWIDHQDGRWIYAKCSECGTVHDTRSNYCPSCGAKMESEDEE